MAKGGREYRKDWGWDAECRMPPQEGTGNWRAACIERCKRGWARDGRKRSRNGTSLAVYSTAGSSAMPPNWRSGAGRTSHELRNEVVEELSPDLMSESRAEQNAPEKHACPRRGNPMVVKTVLGRRQTKRGGKTFWDTEQSDPHLARCWDSHVASEPLRPVETIMRALCTGQGHRRES
jgi:hypothetical protein